MLNHPLKRVLGGLLRAATYIYCRCKSDPVVVLDGVISSSPLPVIALYHSGFHAVLWRFARDLRKRLSMKRHDAVRREFRVSGNPLFEGLNFSANSRSTKIERKKFQPAGFADVVTEQAQQRIWIEHLSLRFFSYRERCPHPTQRNSRFRPLDGFLDDSDRVPFSLRDLALWVRNVLDG